MPADAIWSGGVCGIAGFGQPWRVSITWKPGGQSEPALAGGSLWSSARISCSALGIRAGP